MVYCMSLKIKAKFTLHSICGLLATGVSAGSVLLLSCVLESEGGGQNL